MKNIIQRFFLKGVVVLVLISLVTGCSASDEKDDVEINPLEPLTGQALADAFINQSGNHLILKEIQTLRTIDLKGSIFVEGTVEGNCQEVIVELIDFFGNILGEKSLQVNNGIFIGEVSLEKKPYSSVYLKISKSGETEPIYIREIPFPMEKLKMVHINSPEELEVIHAFEFVLEGSVEPYLRAKTDKLVYRVDEGHNYISEGEINLDKDGKFSKTVNLREIDRDFWGDFFGLSLTLYVFEDENQPERIFGQVGQHSFYYAKPGTETPVLPLDGSETEILRSKIEELSARLALYEPPPPMNYMEPLEKKRFVEKEASILLLPVEGAALIRLVRENTVVDVNDKVQAWNQEEWLYVTIPVYDTPANHKGWIKEADTVPYTRENQPLVQSDVTILEGTPVFRTSSFSQMHRYDEQELSMTVRGRIRERKDGYAVVDCAGGMSFIVDEKYLLYPEVEG